MRRAILLLPALCLVLGCSGGSPREAERVPASGPTGTSASPGRARSEAFIEAGNEAYRKGDFELALKRYAAAAIADPRDPAAYFGMGMTFTRLKREDEARAAYEKARRLAHEAQGR